MEHLKILNYITYLEVIRIQRVFNTQGFNIQITNALALNNAGVPDAWVVKGEYDVINLLTCRLLDNDFDTSNWRWL